jgi:hypothetical protein
MDGGTTFNLLGGWRCDLPLPSIAEQALEMDWETTFNLLGGWRCDLHLPKGYGVS